MAGVSTEKAGTTTADDTLARKSQDTSVISGGHLVGRGTQERGDRYDLHALRWAHHRHV